MQEGVANGDSGLGEQNQALRRCCVVPSLGMRSIITQPRRLTW
jgi:hypothetical protein